SVTVYLYVFVCFFFQAEDGIRDATVTGVQTCALPIFTAKEGLGTLITIFSFELKVYLVFAVIVVVSVLGLVLYGIMEVLERKIRSEERRVGKECRTVWWPEY